MGAVFSQCRMILNAMRRHCKGPSSLRRSEGHWMWIQKAESTLHRERVLVFQWTDFGDCVVVSRTLEGDKDRKILVPQWQRVVLAFHRKQIASPTVKMYLQPDNSLIPEKHVYTRAVESISRPVLCNYAPPCFHTTWFTNKIPSMGHG